MKNLAKAAVAAVIIVVAVSAGLASGSLFGRKAAQNAEAARESAPAIQGEAIDGPVAPSVTERQAALGYAPDASAPPEEADGPEGMTPMMTISPENQALLDAYKGADSAELVFSRTKDGVYSKVTFTQLASFDYLMPERKAILALGEGGKPESQTPGPIAALNGQPVVVVGYMVPVDINAKGEIKSFALTENQLFCCYGIPPAMNEWVMVEMEEGMSAEFFDNMPVAAFGTFDVGEEILDGYVMSLYRMKSNRVVEIRELLQEAETPT